MGTADGANVIQSLAKYAVDGKAVEARWILRISRDFFNIGLPQLLFGFLLMAELFTTNV